jgi:integrase
MASIQERTGTRKDGKKGKRSYQYTVSHTVNGKTNVFRKGGFRNKKEAEIAAAELEISLNKGIIPNLKPIPFDDYFENWMRLYKNELSIATLKHYRYTLERLKEFFGSTPLQEITTYDYQEFLNNLGINKSKETVEKVNGHIRACVKDAIDEQIIPRDFTRKAVLKFTVPAKKESEKYLNFSDSELLLRELLKRLKDRFDYHLLLLALVTGSRYEELVGLTFCDFDFKKNEIRINKTWGYNNRMTNGFGPTKNEPSNRIITVGKKTMDLFKILFETLPDNPNHLVFYNPKSMYKVISNEQANDLLKDVLRDLNIRPLITMHGLRHTHGSVLIYQKASYQYVSKRLGHKDLETTLKVYTHLLKEAREEDDKLAIKTFDDMYEEGNFENV